MKTIDHEVGRHPNMVEPMVESSSNRDYDGDRMFTAGGTMPSLKSDLVARIRRLPKPYNSTAALVPLFESVMNSIHAVREKFGDDVPSKGRISIEIDTPRDKDELKVIVADNGVGLDQQNFDAFQTSDTTHKTKIGGKGVGRLLWLSCFKDIAVSSVYNDEDGHTWRRSFSFVLTKNEQIADYVEERVTGEPTGCRVEFRGLKSDGYKKQFPTKDVTIVNHFVSHFLPTFVGNQSPTVTVCIDKDRYTVPDAATRTYPDGIHKLVENQTTKTVEFGDGQDLTVTLMRCDKAASAAWPASNFAHFVAHGRTVLSEKLDTKFGFSTFGDNDEYVFHAIVEGEYLDDRVNQERTAFAFDGGAKKDIIKSCLSVFQEYLSEWFEKHFERQREVIQRVTAHYPSLRQVAKAAGDAEQIASLQGIISANHTDPEQIFSELSLFRFRQDETQRKNIRNALENLRGKQLTTADLERSLRDAGESLEASAKHTLADYMVRRKVVLEFMREMLKVSYVDRGGNIQTAYRPESVLHTLICPMNYSTVHPGGTAKRVTPQSHELWLIDERLTNATYIASDKRMDKIIDVVGTDRDRPDLVVFDRLYGMRVGKRSNHMLIVELKRPGRSDYGADENPYDQIRGYISSLRKGEIPDFEGRPIPLGDGVAYECFLVADRLGRLEEWTSDWRETGNGRGRIREFQGDYRGFVELIEWDQLLDDADERHVAFFEKMALHL